MSHYTVTVLLPRQPKDVEDLNCILADLLAPFDEISRAGIVLQTPIGRMASADELASVVRFLAGPESTYCIGDVFPVSGGWV